MHRATEKKVETTRGESCDQQSLYLLPPIFRLCVCTLSSSFFPPSIIFSFPPIFFLFRLNFFPFVSIIAFRLSFSFSLSLVISKQSTLAYRGEGVGWDPRSGLKRRQKRGIELFSTRLSIRSGQSLLLMASEEREERAGDYLNKLARLIVTRIRLAVACEFRFRPGFRITFRVHHISPSFSDVN